MKYNSLLGFLLTLHPLILSIVTVLDSERIARAREAPVKFAPAHDAVHSVIARYARPVRIARSALAPGVPHADLFVTRGHALFIDDVLVCAGELINGTTITLYAADEFDQLEFFHIKLETHNVICAEGAQCETQLTVEEAASNFAEYYRLYGAPNVEEVRCAPLLYHKGRRGRLLRSRFRSAISPWFDFREKIDVIRDRLEERGILLCEQMASPS